MKDLDTTSPSETFVLDPNGGDPRFVPAPSSETSELLMNPPGRSQLIYRVGTYNSFLNDMLRLLPQVEVWVQGKAQKPLESLNTEAVGEWASALLSGWAEVADILSFYQERLINEGFLGTAVEPSSKRLILQGIGVETSQPPAAETHLSFQLTPTPAGFESSSKLLQSLTDLAHHGPSETVTVAGGSKVSTVPSQGRAAQTFETSADLAAHSQFNGVKPEITTRRLDQHVGIGATQLRLQGTQTRLTQGRPILIVGGTPGAPEKGPNSARYVRLLTAVEPYRKAGYTWVRWQEPLVPASTVDADGHPSLIGPAVIQPKVLAFGKALPLFGYNARPWAQLPAPKKALYAPIQGGVWALRYGGSSPVYGIAWNGGLPLSAPPLPLAATAFARIGNTLYAATDGQGVFSRKLDEAVGPWRAVGGSAAGLTRRNVQSLIAVGTEIYAGSVGGMVFSSVDGGQTWDQITGGPPTVTGTGDHKQVVSYNLPNTVIRALASPTTYSPPPAELYAGTDRGLYAFDGENWSPDLGTQSPPQVIQEAVYAFVECSAGLVAGTADSVLVLTTDGSWSEIGSQWPSDTAAQSLTAGNDALWAGTPKGLWRLDLTGSSGPQSGSQWSQITLPVTDPSLTALIELSSGALLAGSDAGQLLGSSDGDTWHQLSPQVPTQSLQPARISALAALDGDLFVSAAPFNGFAVHNWPGFHLQPGSVELAQVDKKVVAGSWVVLQQGGLPDSPPSSPPTDALTLAEPVLDASTVYGNEFGIQAQHTALSIDPAAPVEDFDLRTADAWVESRALELFDQEVQMPTPVSGSVVVLDQQLTHRLPLPRKVIVLGRSLDIGLDSPGGVMVPAAAADVQAVAVAASPWQKLGPINRDVRALAAGDHDLFIGTFGQGIYSTLLEYPYWPRELSSQPGDAQINALLQLSGLLVAGTGNGIWARSAGSMSWQGPTLAGEQILSMASFPVAGGLLAGSRSGRLYQLDPLTPSHLPRPAPLAIFEGAVQSLLVLAGQIWVATSSGLFSMAYGVSGDAASGGGASAGTVSWGLPTRAEAGLQNDDVRSLALAPLSGRSAVIAGTAGGVFAQAGSNGFWARLGSGLGSFAGVPVSVNCLALQGDVLWAGLQGDGLWQLELDRPPEDRLWQSAELGLSNDVRALTTAELGRSGRSRSAHSAGSSLCVGCKNASVLTGGDGRRHLTLAQSLITQLSSDPEVIASLDQGNLPSPLIDALQQQDIDLAEPVVIETRRPGRAWRLLQGGRRIYFLWRQDGELEIYGENSVLRLLAAPGADVHTAFGTWQLADDQGFEGNLAAYGGELVWLESSRKETKTSEVATVVQQLPDAADPDQVGDSNLPTRWVLSRPLAGVYDASVTTLLANTSHATHGQSTQQVVGSGDSSQANQSFTLRQPAIDESDPDTGELSSSLEVQVDGVSWSRVRSFVDAGPASRVYVVGTLPDGRQTLTFGDGSRGARLPTGSENVVASYRTAVTSAGLMAGGAVHMPISRALGVRSVENAVPALFPKTSSDRVSWLSASTATAVVPGPSHASTAVAAGGVAPGGTPAAASTPSTQAAQPLVLPSFVQTLNRAVSAEDLAELAASAPGIVDAVTHRIVVGGCRTPLLTVAAEGGRPLEISSQEGKELSQFFLSAGLAGVRPMLASFRPVFFDLHANLQVSAPAQSFQSLRKALLQALTARFGFGRRLALSVAASAIIDTLQSEPGVESVDLTALFRNRDHPTLPTVLSASKGSWDAVTQQPLAAEMLIVNTTGKGVRLNLEST